MKTRLLFVPLLLALVASLAACGGGGGSVPANAVAQVNGQPITTAQFNALLQQALAQFKASGGPAPTPGSQQYSGIRDRVIAYLVQVTELEQQAKKENISVSQADVTKFIANLAKAHGGMKKLTDQLKSQGLTMDEARQEVYVNLIAQKIRDKVTAATPVSTAQEQTYYHTNIAQYTTPTTRSVQYILFRCAAQGSTTCSAAKNRAEKKLADKVEQKLKNGADFSAMAKQYSDDPSTASQGGKYTVTKGQVVPAFDAVAFSLKTGAISQPVDATSAADQGFGWFLVKALGPVHQGHVTPFKDVEASIKQAIQQQQTDQLWGKWLSDLANQYQGKVTYQAGYAPPTTTGLSQSVTTVSTTG